MDLSNKIFLFGGFYPENSEKVIEAIIEKFESGIRDIELYINSDGGYISDLFAITDTIDKYRKEGLKVTTIAVGAAQSAGLFLLMSGDESYAGKNTELMLHGSQGGVYGDAEAHRAYLEKMDLLNEKFSKLVSEKTGITEKEAGVLLKKNEYFTAEEAVKYGIIDGIWDVEDTVSELSDYISDNLAASSNPNEQDIEVSKFLNSMNQIKKIKSEDKMATELEQVTEKLQASGVVIEDYKSTVAGLNAKVTELQGKSSDNETFKAEFFAKQKDSLIAKSIGLVAEDKKESFKAKLEKFKALDYDAFEDLTNELIQANGNFVKEGIVIDAPAPITGQTEEEKIMATFRDSQKATTDYLEKTPNNGGK